MSVCIHTVARQASSADSESQGRKTYRLPKKYRPPSCPPSRLSKTLSTPLTFCLSSSSPLSLFRFSASLPLRQPLHARGAWVPAGPTMNDSSSGVRLEPSASCASPVFQLCSCMCVPRWGSASGDTGQGCRGLDPPSLRPPTPHKPTCSKRALCIPRILCGMYCFSSGPRPAI